MPYYSELGLYSGPSTSSYIPLYLSGPYSNHSSILANNFSRPPSTYTKSSRGFRSYKPHLSTISERRTDSPLRRINSPKVSYTPVIIPRPIKINTADIDVSINKYRKYDRQRNKAEGVGETKQESKSPSPSRSIESPRSSTELKDATPTNNIKRERATVRLRTIHKDKVINPTSYRKWRENFDPDELYPDESESPKMSKKTQKSPGELLKEKFLIPSENPEDSSKMQEKKIERRKSVKSKQGVIKTPSFHDICTAITSQAIDEELNPGQPIEVQRRQSRQFSTEDILKEFRRTSVELSDSEKNVIETILSKVEADKQKNKSDKVDESRGSVKKRKKYTKTHSARLNLDTTEEDLSKQPPMQRRPTLKKISRTRSSNLDLDEVQKRLNSEEPTQKTETSMDEGMSSNRKPLITATVNIDEKPQLKAIIDDIMIEESPSPKLKKGGKLKFNFTVEEIEEKETALNSKRIVKVKTKIENDQKQLFNSKAKIESNKIVSSKSTTTDDDSKIVKPKAENNVMNKKEVASTIETTLKRSNEVKPSSGLIASRDESGFKKDETGEKICESIRQLEKAIPKLDNTETMKPELNKVQTKKEPQKIESFKVEVPSNKKPLVSKIIRKKHTARIGMVLEEIKEFSSEERTSSQEKHGKREIKTCNRDEKMSTTQLTQQKFFVEEMSSETKREDDKTVKKFEPHVKIQGKEEVQVKNEVKENASLLNIKALNATNENKTKNAFEMKLKKNTSPSKKQASESKTVEINNNIIQKSESSEDFWKAIGPKESVRISIRKKLGSKQEEVAPTVNIEKFEDSKNIQNSMKIPSLSAQEGKDTYEKVKISSKIEKMKEPKLKEKEERKIEEGNEIIVVKEIESSKTNKTPATADRKVNEVQMERKVEITKDDKKISSLTRITKSTEVEKVIEINESSEVEKSNVFETEMETVEVIGENISEAEMKRIISKRSLVQKAKKVDPDLVVFEPPPTPEPVQPEEKEEKKDVFVPLQSNRLSQWMHPFKKPEQFEECPVEIYARPKTIRKRHVPRGRFNQWERRRPGGSSSEEESDDSSDSDEDSSSEEEEKGGHTGVVGANYGASTSSNDSGFDSGAAKNKDKDCDVNCHKKCEKLTANLCGVNQKLIVEAIESVRKGSTSDARDSPSLNPATNPAFAIDPNEEECCKSSTFQGFQKSGRITPPATTIPRFRKYCVEDFNFLKVLGKGSFGKVLLAELKDTEYYYAIKCLKKDVVLEDDDVECTLIERKVLALGTKHPYLCHLLCTFQTESHLFFVMEYLNGGDLMFHIQQSGRFPEDRARFYAAEIVSGLKFLHNKGIVYRDLKLDNILLDFDGHVRIADFGMCKLQVFLDRMADTFCGTPDYMAPEIIRGQHYNQSVDWWSFGVLLYEMLLGQSPFSGCDEDELFWSICNEKPVLPRFLSPETSRILSMLLEKDATKRLGTRFSPCGDIKDQPFFKSVDWDQLEARLLEPPFKPNLSHPLDTKYFDKHFTIEQAKLTPIETHILQSMDQTQFQGFSYTNPNATDK